MAGFAAANVARSEIDTITCGSLRARLAKGDALQVVDVRTAAEFLSGHIPGSVNIPIRAARPAGRTRSDQGDHRVLPRRFSGVSRGAHPSAERLREGAEPYRRNTRLRVEGPGGQFCRAMRKQVPGKGLAGRGGVPAIRCLRSSQVFSRRPTCRSAPDLCRSTRCLVRKARERSKSPRTISPHTMRSQSSPIRRPLRSIARVTPTAALLYRQMIAVGPCFSASQLSAIASASVRSLASANHRAGSIPNSGERACQRLAMYSELSIFACALRKPMRRCPLARRCRSATRMQSGKS